MIRPLLPLAALTLASVSAAQVGTPHCFGNACPCGNDDPTAGCGNSGFDGDASTGATNSVKAALQLIYVWNISCARLQAPLTLRQP